MLRGISALVRGVYLCSCLVGSSWGCAAANTPRRNGHGCMLQYALLHLFGYAVSLDDIKNFRVSLIA